MKTTQEIVDWWDEGDNDDNHKDNLKWFSESEVREIVEKLTKKITPYLTYQETDDLKKELHYFLLSQTKATNREYTNFLEEEVFQIIDKQLGAE